MRKIILKNWEVVRTNEPLQEIRELIVDTRFRDWTPADWVMLCFKDCIINLWEISWITDEELEKKQ